MKSFKYILFCVLAALFMPACEDGIDPVNPLDPGPDASPPVITISTPAEGQSIYELEEFATIQIRGEVRDDIELESVTLLLDAMELITYKDFKDYRRLVIDYTYTKVTSGKHVLTIRAKDKSGKETSKSVNFEKDGNYRPAYSGEIFFMSFDDLAYIDILSGVTATKIGSPGFSTGGKINAAYAGATDSYLSFPAMSTGLLNNTFSATFWYKFTTVAPDNRAGILSVTPDPVGSATSGSRNFGFRFIREGSGTNQTFKINVGTGSSESWVDGGAASSLNPSTSTDWIFVAITISGTDAAIFFNGVQAHRATHPGIDWTGCASLSIMSGRPNFVEWSHFSDLSLMDELRIFNKSLTQQEIQKIYDDTK